MGELSASLMLLPVSPLANTRAWHQSCITCSGEHCMHVTMLLYNKYSDLPSYLYSLIVCHNLSVDTNFHVFCGFLNEDVRKFQSNSLFLRAQQFRLFAQRMLQDRYLPPSPAPPLWHPFISTLFIVAIHFVPSLLFLRSLSDTS